MWIGGNAGLSLWTGEHFELFTKRDGLPDDSVSGVNVAHSGTVWITTRVGMCQFVGGRIVPYAFQTDSQGRSPEYLGAYEDQRGNQWAFGDTYLINLTENKRFNYFRSSEPASLRIWSLCEGRSGVLWIGTSGQGLLCFEDNHFQHVTLGEHRWPYDVRAICEDREGNLWLGTSGGGLVQLRPQSVQGLGMDQGLPDSPPTALALDARGRIYVGLQRGGLFVGESGKFDRLGAASGLAPESHYSSLCVGRDGTLWAGTLENGLFGWRGGRAIQLTTADGLADDSVLAVCTDAHGAVWVSTSAGTVHRFVPPNIFRFDAAQGVSGAPVTAMLPSAGGGLWLGTADGRILRRDEQAFNEVAVANPGRQTVLALCEGAQKRLWIGTDGGGLSCLASGTAWNWTTNDGLPSDVLTAVLEDGTTNLWLATGAGIYRVEHGDVAHLFAQPKIPLACKLISTAKVAPDVKPVFGGTRAAVSPDGHVWFATSKGLLKISPRQSGERLSTFPVYLESAAINGSAPMSLLHAGAWSAPSAATGPIKTPVNVRSLEIHYTALSFAAPEDVQFRHKLEGSDPTGWMKRACASLGTAACRAVVTAFESRPATREVSGRRRREASRFWFRPRFIIRPGRSACMF